LLIQSKISDDGTKRPNKLSEVRLGELKGKLRELLRQPLIAKGVSTRYITSGNHAIADDILAGECEIVSSPHPFRTFLTDFTDREGMLGVLRTDPSADIIQPKTKRGSRIRS
jgi:hypothetical protein